MMNHYLSTPFFLLAASLLPYQGLTALDPLNLDASPIASPIGQDGRALTIHHQILGRVNGKAISTLDVSKKLDQLFKRDFPQYADTEEIRYQFFMTNWQMVYQDLVSKELILADVTEKKMPISHGDVREELESMFGPNIIENLEKAQMTYNEAWEMIRSDIAIRRMMWARVNQKATNAVTPKLIREAYEKLLSEQTEAAEWRYRVISIRGENAEQTADVAAAACEALYANASTIDSLSSYLDETNKRDATVVIKASELFSRTEATISSSHKEGLLNLAPDGFSTPIEQLSRSGQKIFRIFYLEDRQEPTPPVFSEVADSLHSQLIQGAAEKETVNYFETLRAKYEVEDLVDINDPRTPILSFG